MSFDLVARSYQLLETIRFGQSLQRARVFWIEKIPRPRRVLIVGEGNGRFLRELLRVHRGIEVDCVDASVQMLNLARARVQAEQPEYCDHVQFIHQDILKWSPCGPYDLVVTHFVLDCFRRGEVEAIVGKLAAVSSPDAVWLLADFSIPPNGRISRAWAKLWLRLMYMFFRHLSGITARRLVDPAPFLAVHNFALESAHSTKAGMVRSELWRRPS